MAAHGKQPNRVVDYGHTMRGLSTIKGIFSPSNPSVVLEAAIAHCAVPVGDDLKAELFQSKQFIKRAEVIAAIAEDRARGMTNERARTLFMYTVESGLYGALNATLREEDRAKLLPFFPYIRLLLEAYYCLPEELEVRNLLRGVRLDLVAKYPGYYDKGEAVVWFPFSSCTNLVEVMESEQFLGQSGPRTMFQIATRAGRAIERYSAIPREGETLLPPGIVLLVVSVAKLGNGLTLVQCADHPDAPSMTPEPPDFQGMGWACFACTLFNAPAAANCNACGAPKVSAMTPFLPLGCQSHKLPLLR